jgi:hypothetical protein
MNDSDLLKMNDEDNWRWMSIRFIEDEWWRLLRTNNKNYPWDLLKMNDSDNWRWMIQIIEDEW